jgi:hypothetical protein
MDRYPNTRPFHIVSLHSCLTIITGAGFGKYEETDVFISQPYGQLCQQAEFIAAFFA